MSQTNHRVLLVEDDKIAQMAFERLVSRQNLPYDYAIAGSVCHARQVLQEARFDVAIVDYNLGDGTAFDLADALADTPTIFATGAGNQELAVRAMKAGAYDYLIKDSAQDYLKLLPEIINRAIKQKKAEQELEQYHNNLEELVRQRAEELAAEKELLSVTFASMTDGVVVVDDHRRVMLLNNVAERLTGANLNDARGKPADHVIKLYDERSKEALAIPTADMPDPGAGPTGPAAQVVGITLGQNGKENPVAVEATPIRTERGRVTGTIILMRDLSQQRQVDRMKTDFVSSVSHELRTPLTSVKAYTATILRDPNMPEQTRREFLTAIDEEADRLTELVNDLLEISRLESGTVEVIRERVDVKAVAEKIVSKFERSARAKGIQLDTEIDPCVHPILGDPTKIEWIVSNLLSNAVKFTPPSGRVRVSVQSRDNDLVISVSDTGMGIPENEIPKVFDRFYRVRRQGDQTPGTGLGLAIVRETTAIYGGTVDVRSRPGHGTTFTVVLPTAPETAPQSAIAAAHM